MRQRNGRMVSMTDLAWGPSGIGESVIGIADRKVPKLGHCPFEWNRSIGTPFSVTAQSNVAAPWVCRPGQASPAISAFTRVFRRAMAGRAPSRDLVNTAAAYLCGACGTAFLSADAVFTGFRLSRPGP